MATPTIDRLIVNSPYAEPTKHWKYDPATRLFDLADGRRPAGFVRASVASKTFDDPGVFVPLELPNQIRLSQATLKAKGADASPDVLEEGAGHRRTVPASFLPRRHA